MDDILLWAIGSAAGLLLVAGGVAAWEHLRRSVRPQDEFTSSTPRAVNVDVRLDRLTAAPEAPESLEAPEAPQTPVAAESDLGQRRAVLDDALARMAQPSAEAPAYWADTTPMVAPGQLAPQDARPPQREFSASQQP